MKCYDRGKESKFIMYFDVNSLYGSVMSQYLPYRGFKWLNKKEIDKSCLSLIGENSSIGFILQVDLKYSDELHKMHNDYL